MAYKRKVQLAVISDVHLGTFGCQAKELFQYLNSIDPEVLVFNGDIVDIWQFSKHYWPSSHMMVINHIISLISKGTKIGVQTYTREIVKHSYFVPYLKAKLINAENRNVAHTAMNWEIHPPSLYEVIKKVAAYKGVKKIIVTENGAAFNDVLKKGAVHDSYRINYLQQHIAELKRIKDEGINVMGYFVWSFIDNFEWSEGYHPRFGIVYIDFKTQQRFIKDSGYWYQQFLKGK